MASKKSAATPADPLAEKRALWSELTARLAADLDVADRAVQASREGATHEEAKPENDKDTRALEQSYLARGQAQRAEELRKGLAETESLRPRAFGEDAPIALGALVEVEEGDASLRYLVASAGGGLRLEGDVVVVTPASPLGRALVGARVGDEVEVTAGGKRRALAISRLT